MKKITTLIIALLLTVTIFTSCEKEVNTELITIECTNISDLSYTSQSFPDSSIFPYNCVASGFMLSGVHGYGKTGTKVLGDPHKLYYVLNNETIKKTYTIIEGETLLFNIWNTKENSISIITGYIDGKKVFEFNNDSNTSTPKEYTFK